jgi:hypothetical protein
VPTEDRTDFVCTLSDRTVWAKRDGKFQQVGDFGKYSLGSGTLLLDNGRSLIYTADGGAASSGYQVRAMDLGTGNTERLCSVSELISTVRYDKNRERLYVGSYSLWRGVEASVLCFDIGARRVLWEVPSLSVEGLHIAKEGVVVADEKGIRVLDHETGAVLRGRQFGEDWGQVNDMDDIVAFDRFLIHPFAASVWDIGSPGEFRQVATLADLGYGATISDGGLLYYVAGSRGYHEVSVIDLSQLLDKK